MNTDSYYQGKKVVLVIKNPVKLINVISAIQKDFWVSDEIDGQNGEKMVIVEENQKHKDEENKNNF